MEVLLTFKSVNKSGGVTPPVDQARLSARLAASLSIDWCVPARELTYIYPIDHSCSVMFSSVRDAMDLNTTVIL